MNSYVGMTVTMVKKEQGQDDDCQLISVKLTKRTSHITILHKSSE